MAKTEPAINRITHKELQIIYGLTRDGAIRRLNTIRSSLGKKKQHTLTVVAFCKEEDLTLDEFDVLYYRAISR